MPHLSMPTQNELSPRGRLIFGLLCLALGIFPVLAAFDIGPLNRRDIHGPPWLGAAAGGVFVMGGIALLAGRRGREHPVGYLLAFGITAAFAAIGNWIAVGTGPRECSISLGGLFFPASPAAGEIACRAAFGMGAGVLDGLLVWMLGRGLRQVTGPGALADGVEKLGLGVLLLSLAPVLIPLLLVLVGKVVLEGYREYRRTGKWPRNEAFIARKKKSGT